MLRMVTVMGVRLIKSHDDENEDGVKRMKNMKGKVSEGVNESVISFPYPFNLLPSFLSFSFS